MLLCRSRGGVFAVSIFYRAFTPVCVSGIGNTSKGVRRQFGFILDVERCRCPEVSFQPRFIDNKDAIFHSHSFWSLTKLSMLKSRQLVPSRLTCPHLLDHSEMGEGALPAPPLPSMPRCRRGRFPSRHRYPSLVRQPSIWSHGECHGELTQTHRHQYPAPTKTCRSHLGGSHIYRSARFRLTHCVAKNRNFPVYSFQQSDWVRVPVRTPQSQSVRLRLVQRHFCQNFSQPVASSTHLSSGYVCLSNDGISSCNEFCSDIKRLLPVQVEGVQARVAASRPQAASVSDHRRTLKWCPQRCLPTVAHVHVLHLFQFHFTVTGQLTSRPFFWDFVSTNPGQIVHHLAGVVPTPVISQKLERCSGTGHIPAIWTSWSVAALTLAQLGADSFAVGIALVC